MYDEQTNAHLTDILLYRSLLLSLLHVSTSTDGQFIIPFFIVSLLHVSTSILHPQGVT